MGDKPRAGRNAVGPRRVEGHEPHYRSAGNGAAESSLGVRASRASEAAEMPCGTVKVTEVKDRPGPGRHGVGE